MALDANTLSQLFITKVKANFKKKMTKQQLRELEFFTDAMAEAIVEHFRDDAEIAISIDNTSIDVDVNITTSDAGLQRLPVSLVANEPTVGPAATKTISGTGVGTGTGTGTLT